MRLGGRRSTGHRALKASRMRYPDSVAACWDSGGERLYFISIEGKIFQCSDNPHLLSPSHRGRISICHGGPSATSIPTVTCTRANLEPQMPTPQKDVRPRASQAENIYISRMARPLLLFFSIYVCCSICRMRNLCFAVRHPPEHSINVRKYHTRCCSNATTFLGQSSGVL